MKTMLHKEKNGKNNVNVVKTKPALKEVKIFFIGSLIILAGIVGCSKKNDTTNSLKCGTGLWTQWVESETSGFTAAIIAYGSNPTQANCENYKKAGNAYLDALSKVKDCVPAASLPDYKDAIEEARKSLSEISCQ